MGRARTKAEAEMPVSHYHCVSCLVDRNFVLGELIDARLSGQLKIARNEYQRNSIRRFPVQADL